MIWSRSFSLTLHQIRRKLPASQPATCCRCKYLATKARSKTADYFITTPIFYVNASPHIGHLYTVLLADVMSRWHQFKGDNTLLSTGTDEHGLKIQQAAAYNKQKPSEFCDIVSRKFQDLFNTTDVGYTDFIRTTEDRHKMAVEHFWNRLEKKGFIYKGSYEGWYSVSDEAFLSESEVKDGVKDGNPCKMSVESEQPVTWMKEENYMFKLSQFKHKLHQWLDSGVIHPRNFEADVRQMVDGLKDLSVSRQSDRLSWGIPVPSDNSQTIYVWLDALVNYLTVAGYPDNLTRWPPDCQVIGKDILRFHAIYWPAFLMAADLQPPKQLLCHSHWTVDNTKMSKSRGNVVDPMTKIHQYSVDGLRYFLLRVGVPHLDGNYSDTKAIECINSELVNVLGNLLNRCTSAIINPSQVFPACDKTSLERVMSPGDKDMYYSLQHLPDIIDNFYNEFAVYKALEKIVSYLHWTNSFVEHQKPWQLAKKDDSLEDLTVVLHVTMVTLRNCGILLQPVVPNMSDRLLNRLNVSKNCRTFDCAKELGFTEETVKLGDDKSVLLQRIKL